MKKLLSLFFALLVAQVWPFAAFAGETAGRVVQSLNSADGAAWRFCCIKSAWAKRTNQQTNWRPARVPGSVHTDLMREGVIADPFYRLNERGVQWVDKEDWLYETTFEPTAALLAAERQELELLGLDTYAEVRLNGELLCKADNMFRTWRVDVTGRLKAGPNRLAVKLISPAKIDVPRLLAIPYRYHSETDQSEQGGLGDMRISVFARKAGYHYGWDWGPRLVTLGIWRPVRLVGYTGAAIDNVHFVQQSVSARRARVRAEVNVRALHPMQVRVAVTLGGQRAEQTVSLQAGDNCVPVDLTVERPQLWWTNGLGRPYLYDLKTTLSADGRQLDADCQKVGLRSLELVREKDASGRSFYFKLNGVPVFMKGANWIPRDNFLERVTPSAYRRSLTDAAAAHMNMLRVWGGGIYESDDFYHLCDSLGLLVWQDFTFACAVYPADSAFLENMRHEAIDNVVRLRNHPSLALWCGNNENQMLWFESGLKLIYGAQGSAVRDTIYRQLCRQYYEVLPRVLAEYDNTRPYTPSSPYADSLHPTLNEYGDVHYWSVWSAKAPVEDFARVKGRFFSEYGFEALPEYNSVLQFAPEEEDHSIYSDVMQSHQRVIPSDPMARVDSIVCARYRRPKDFRSMLYVSQILQADACRIAMEAHRRDMPHCMGSLYWQLDDCWPVASWAGIDYYGRWRPLHYMARRCYADVLLSPYVHDGVVELFVVNDRLRPVKGKLSLRALRLSGGTAGSRTQQVSVAANSSRCVLTVPLKELLAGADARDVALEATLTDGQATHRSLALAVLDRDLRLTNPQLRLSVAEAEGGYRVTVKAAAYARAVFLSLDGVEDHVSENYFDLPAGEERTVTIQTTLGRTEFEQQLKVQSLYDSYEHP